MIKNILDFVEVYNRRDCKIDEFNPILNYSVEGYIDDFKPTSLKYNNGYKIKAEIGTIFYAPPSEFNQAFREAKLNLLRCVYGDILDMIGLIRSDVYGGNKKAVYDKLDELVKALTRIP